MPKNDKSGPSFVEALRNELEPQEEIRAFETPFFPPQELPEPLPINSFKSPADKVLQPNPVLLRRRATFHYSVFIVHRVNCQTCRTLLKALIQNAGPDARIDPPPCEHNDKEAYEALVNRGLREEVTMATFREETLRDGSVQICVGWAEFEKKTEPPLTPEGSGAAPEQ
jgi:hypothetical protein